LATHEIDNYSLHNTPIICHSAQQNKTAYQQYKSSLLLPPRQKIFTKKKHELSSIVLTAAHTDKIILIFVNTKIIAKKIRAP